MRGVEALLQTARCASYSSTDCEQSGNERGNERRERASRGHQRLIRGHQWPSEVISGHQEVINETREVERACCLLSFAIPAGRHAGRIKPIGAGPT
jgi:hypothetical protein